MAIPGKLADVFGKPVVTNKGALRGVIGADEVGTVEGIPLLGALDSTLLLPGSREKAMDFIRQ